MNPVLFLVISIIVIFSLIGLLGFYSSSTNNTSSPLISSPYTLNSRMWQSTVSASPLKITFPELCSASNYGIVKPNLDKVSLAISGGGSVSFGCTIGFFRALNRMGLKNKAQYISTVSGGSWFYGVYSYCQSNSYLTDDIILGLSTGCSNSSDIPNPSKMFIYNLQNQNKSNTLYYGHIFANKDLLSYLIEALLSQNISIDDAFSSTVGKIILDPYGLNNDVPISLNAAHAQDIITRNPNIGTPLTLPPGMPFWICNTTLFFNYVNQYPYCVVPLTPLYSGIPQVITQNNNNIGGVLLENFAFGNTNPPSGTNLSLTNSTCAAFKNVNLDKISNIRTLRDMIGASSTAFASILYDKRVILPLVLPKNVVEILPKYNIWGTSPLIGTTSDSQCIPSSLLSSSCDVPYGYDPYSCTRSGFKCYSKSTKQCVYNSDCTLSVTKGECVNTNPSNSSLNCKLGLLGCNCAPSTTTPYKQSTTKTLNSQTTRLSDGSFSDNNGVLSLLARGCKRIISFVNTSGQLSQSFETSCTEILHLFGLMSNNIICTGVTSAGNDSQVFSSSDFTYKILPQLKQNESKGGPVFARSSLNVLQNKNNGIAGGYIVDIMFIYIHPATKFIEQLPQETRDQIGILGLFNKFPSYNVFFQNINSGVVYLTLEQTNLLSSYTDWCLNQEPLKTNIIEMYK